VNDRHDDAEDDDNDDDDDDEEVEEEEEEVELADGLSTSGDAAAAPIAEPTSSSTAHGGHAPGSGSSQDVAGPADGAVGSDTAAASQTTSIFEQVVEVFLSLLSHPSPSIIRTRSFLISSITDSCISRSPLHPLFQCIVNRFVVSSAGSALAIACNEGVCANHTWSPDVSTFLAAAAYAIITKSSPLQRFLLHRASAAQSHKLSPSSSITLSSFPTPSFAFLFPQSKYVASCSFELDWAQMNAPL